MVQQISKHQTVPKSGTSNKLFVRLLCVVFFAITLAYANHFDNVFHFDDEHTIVSNHAIRQLDVWNFFKDGTTFSSLPSNQSYRPYITLINAIDYKIGGDTYPGVFHVHIFLTFLLTVGLLIVLVRKLLDKIQFSGYNQYWALLVGAVFGLLCANAETVNYIIQRAEIEAGLFILAGFAAFLRGGIWRKWHLYLVFPFIGFFAKEMAFVFAPLLFLYVSLFEEEADLMRFYRGKEFSKLWRAFVKVLPAVVLTGVCLVFYSKMLPETFSTGAYDRYRYLITQPFVMLHYILTFFVPYNLSADTDWTVFRSLADYRVWVGFVLVAGLVYLALKASARKETRLFSFGILWFFISLLPTSSVIPLAEVLNDHRCFIPYMGLTIAVVFGVNYLLHRFFHEKISLPRVRYLLLALVLLFLASNAYGVYQRNKVWDNRLSLWKDVTEKSPKNGRGFMNYGLALMARARYAEAEENFNRAAELYPDYSLVYTNLGILKSATGDKEEAERFFNRSLICSTTNHIAYYYFGKFLFDTGRYQESKYYLEEALRRHPGYSEAQSLLSAILNDDVGEGQIGKRTAEDYLGISLLFFQEGKYEECIEAAQKALDLKADYVEAYNNIGIANVRLGRYDQGLEAYRKALELRPDNQLVKNNMAEVLKLMQ